MGGEDRVTRGTETRISAIEDTLKGITQQLKILDKLNALDSIVKDITDLKKGQKKFEENLNLLNKKISTLTDIEQELGTVKAELLAQKNAVLLLRNDNEFLHRSLHRRECEITGLEDLKGTTPKQVLFSVAAKSACKLTDSDISWCFAKTVGPSKKCVISVKFAVTEVRDSFMKRAKLCRLTTADLGLSYKQNIFINELLSPYCRRLLYNTKALAKQHNWKAVWIYSGAVMLRRKESDVPIKISQDSDLIVLK